MRMTAAGRSAEYVATTPAPARRAYRLIAGIDRWPLLFAPCLHVEQLGPGPDGGDRFRMWVASGDDVRAWTSTRHADEQALRVTFRQERPSAPLSAAEGTWRFEPDTAGTRITLTNAYTLTTADEATATFLAGALERHNADEVAAVRYWAERPEDLDDLMFSLTQEILLDLPADTVHDLLCRGAGPRVRLPGRRLVLSGPAAPAPLRAHTATWSVTDDGTRSRVLVRHDAALDPDAAALGGGPARARATAEEQLRRSSLQILESAGAHAADRATAR
jgi:aromatase